MNNYYEKLKNAWVECNEPELDELIHGLKGNFTCRMIDLGRVLDTATAYGIDARLGCSYSNGALFFHVKIRIPEVVFELYFYSDKIEIRQSEVTAAITLEEVFELLLKIKETL